MLDKERSHRIMQELEKEGLSQILITDPVAIFYLTGRWIHPGERFLGLYLGKGRESVLFINTLLQFSEEIGLRKVYYSDTDNIYPLLAQAVDSSKKLAVDKILPARFLLPMMEAGLASGYTNGSPAVDQTRSIKDALEIEIMRESSRINDLCMEDFKKLIKPGITELETAEQMLSIYKSHGASAYSFDPIVAFGMNAADPHHMPDHTILQEGDCVLFDVGGVYENYCSDMTRTYFWKKKPDELQARIYNLVREANERAEEMCAPGIIISDIDKCARDIITDAGFGPYFTHRLGHFIGIEDHEYGDVSLTNQNRECPGITHSIEPGIYYPKGRVGVRIEDLVLITEDGHEVLNHMPKEIEVLE